jgi:hypothetical protein
MTLEFMVQAGLAGFIASYLHLMMALWGPAYGLPRLDFGMGIAVNSWGESFEGKDPPYWAGFFAVLMNGVLFGLLYASVVGPWLAGYIDAPPAVLGMVYGAILWFPAQFIFVPFFLKGGVLGLHHHKLAWLTAVVVHGTYGLIVGWLSPVF